MAMLRQERLKFPTIPLRGLEKYVQSTTWQKSAWSKRRM